ncbi:hypothetical protein DITRI_Ditri16bG0114700 [Diplodiscus trichospermus]
MTDELDDLWKMLRLTEEEDDKIVETDYAKENPKDEERNWLVGKLLTNKPFNKEAMMAILKFQNGKDKDRILEGAPWSFDKHLLMFHDFKGEWRPEDYVFQQATFWVRVYNLLLGMRTKSTGEKIGRRLAELIAVDEGLDRGGWASFLRLTCGWLRHLDSDCDEGKSETTSCEEVQQYGDWLRASPLKKGLVFNKENSSAVKTEAFLAQIRAKGKGPDDHGDKAIAASGGPVRRLILGGKVSLESMLKSRLTDSKHTEAGGADQTGEHALLYQNVKEHNANEKGRRPGTKQERMMGYRRLQKIRRKGNHMPRKQSQTMKRYPPKKFSPQF